MPYNKKGSAQRPSLMTIFTCTLDCSMVSQKITANASPGDSHYMHGPFFMQMCSDLLWRDLRQMASLVPPKAVPCLGQRTTYRLVLGGKHEVVDLATDQDILPFPFSTVQTSLMSWVLKSKTLCDGDPDQGRDPICLTISDKPVTACNGLSRPRTTSRST